MRVAVAGQALWLLFLASWTIAMLWTGRATSRGPLALRLAYFASFAVAFALLFAAPTAAAGGVLLFPSSWSAPLWRGRAALGWLLVAVEAVAFAFAWWARLHLGRLWSGMLTLREGHRVVDSGPYRLVRHPIYTGFLAAAWAFALLMAGVTALAGAAVLTLVMTIKANGEERLLRRELGAAAYDAYAARTPMLVPFASR